MYIYKNVYVYIYIYKYICKCECVYVCMCVCVCVFVCVSLVRNGALYNSSHLMPLHCHYIVQYIDMYRDPKKCCPKCYFLFVLKYIFCQKIWPEILFSPKFILLVCYIFHKIYYNNPALYSNLNSFHFFATIILVWTHLNVF